MDSDTQIQGDEASAVSAFAVPTVETLKKRSDFVAASHAKRQGTAGMLLQARARDDGSSTIRIGFTCSKKVGNAVARNRAKRRLRAVAHEILRAQGRAGWDYVLVGRAEATASRPFAELLRDCEYALRKVHA